MCWGEITAKASKVGIIFAESYVRSKRSEEKLSYSLMKYNQRRE